MIDETRANQALDAKVEATPEGTAYALNHLIATLIDAGKIERLHTLLWEEEVTTAQSPSAEGPPVKWPLFDTRQGKPVNAVHKNTWYARKEAVGDIDGYVENIERAWQLAKEGRVYDHHQKDLGRAIGLQCGYALCNASVGRLAANVPVRLLVALVRRETWSPGQAVAYVQQMPDEAGRAKALAALAPSLQAEFDRARNAAYSITKIPLRYTTLLSLLPILPQEEQKIVLRETLIASRNMENLLDRAGLLAALLPYVDEDERLSLGEEALQAARAVTQNNSDYHTRPLVQCAPYLTTAQLVEAFSISMLFHWNDAKAHAIAGIAPYLPKALLQQAWDAIGDFEKLLDRGLAYAGLLPYLAEAEQKIALSEILAACREKTTRDEQQVRLLVLFGQAVTRLPEKNQQALWDGILQRVAHIKYCWHKADALEYLAPSLPANSLGKAIQIAQKMKREDGYHKFRVLVTLASRLPDKQRARICTDALALVPDLPKHGAVWHEPDNPVAEALTMLAELAPGEEQAQKFHDAYAATLVMKNYKPDRNFFPRVEDIELERLMAALALSLAKAGEEAEAFLLAQTIHDPGERLLAFAALAPYLTTSHLHEIVRESQTRNKADDCIQLLTAVIPHLPEAERPALLATTLPLVKEGADPQLFAHLLPYEDLYQQAFAQALTHSQGWELLALVQATGFSFSEEQQRKTLAVLPSRSWRDRVKASLLMSLAPHLSSFPLLQEAVKRAEELKDAPAQASGMGEFMANYGFRSRALAALAIQLAQRGVPQEALKVLREIESDESQVEAMLQIAPSFTPSLVLEAFEMAKTISQVHRQTRLLATLLPSLPDQSRIEAFNAIGAIENAYQRAKVLLPLLPALSEQERTRGINDIFKAQRSLEPIFLRMEVLAELYPHLSPSEQPSLVAETIKAAENIPFNDQEIKDRLPLLALYLASIGLIEQAQRVVQHIQITATRVSALVQIMPYLSPGQLPNVLQTALTQMPEIASVDHIRTLKELVSFWDGLSFAACYEILSDMLTLYSKRSQREGLFVELRVLIPIIEKCGGVEAIRQTYRTVQHVTRCWR